jgi:REP element-mobilizing transposase RayT
LEIYALLVYVAPKKIAMNRVCEMKVVDSRKRWPRQVSELTGYIKLSRDRKGAVCQDSQEKRMRYFITFACYGWHLHGDESGSVDQRHNLPGSRELEADLQRVLAERRLMRQAPYSLDRNGRAAVLEALKEVCLYRGWSLLAAHVRTNHVHVVVDAEVRPEKVMNDFKSYASRGLNRLAGNESDRRRWAHHGSTRWLWMDQDVREAIRYVVQEQGEPMAVFLEDVL